MNKREAAKRLRVLAALMRHDRHYGWEWANDLEEIADALEPELRTTEPDPEPSPLPPSHEVVDVTFGPREYLGEAADRLSAKKEEGK